MSRTILILSLLLMMLGCGEVSPQSKGGEIASKEASEYERGPHRGRMLRSGDFAVEVTIFEDGTDPEFRVYPYWRNKPLDPRQVNLTMIATRLGDRKDPFVFTQQGDFLKAGSAVKEPHSFDVAVSASYQNTRYDWSYSSYEGRTIIDAAAAEAGGLKIEAVGPATIHETLDLPGRVVLQPQGRAEVKAWYPGRIIEMTKVIGQQVRQGELLARVESTDTLRTYSINAPISGIVAERSGNLGDVSSSALYVVTDTSKLQVTFFAFPRDAERLQPGQPVHIQGLGDQRAQSAIQFLLPTTDPATQTVPIAAELKNPDGNWRAGTAVEGKVTVESTPVQMAVRTRALQRFRDFTVVYTRVGDTYEVRMLKLGRRTAEWTEVLSGIDPGEVYVSDNAFLVRADIEKAGASHDH